MPRGGKREGAGRPKGSKNAKTKERLEHLKRCAKGLEPLDVMLTGMAEAYEQDKMELAVEIAAKAAPYMHPRLQAIEQAVPKEDRTLEEIAKAVRGSNRGLPSQRPDSPTTH